MTVLLVYSASYFVFVYSLRAELELAVMRNSVRASETVAFVHFTLIASQIASELCHVCHSVFQ